VAEARAAIAEHLDDHYHFYGEAGGVRIAGKHLGWYTKGLPGAAELRQRLFTIESMAQAEAMFSAYLVETAALAAA